LQLLAIACTPRQSSEKGSSVTSAFTAFRLSFDLTKSSQNHQNPDFLVASNILRHLQEIENAPYTWEEGVVSTSIVCFTEIGRQT
jgi:hypothetical protein